MTVKNFVILAGLMFDVKLNNNHIIMDSTKIHNQKGYQVQVQICCQPEDFVDFTWPPSLNYQAAII